jgi:dynein heavy chain
VNSIKAIPRHDISEIKVMKKPPKVIKLILRALCIFLNIEPIMKKRKGTGGPNTYTPSYWLAAQSKDLLGNPNLTQHLTHYDRSKISPEMMEKIENEVFSNPDYTFDNAYHASKAAPALF